MYKNIADMTKSYCKSETFCKFIKYRAEVVKTTKKMVCTQTRLEVPCVIPERRLSRLEHYFRFGKMVLTETFCVKTTRSLTGVIAKNIFGSLSFVTSNYDFEQAIKKCHSYYATCISDVSGPSIGREFNPEHGLRFEVQVQFYEIFQSGTFRA